MKSTKQFTNNDVPEHGKQFSITLEDFELLACLRMWAPSKRLNYSDCDAYKTGSSNQWIGVPGEYAHHLFFEITRFDWEVVSGGDGGFDFLHKGIRFDSKAAGNHHSWYIGEETTEKKVVDAYSFVTMDLATNTFWFRGWLQSREVCEMPKIKSTLTKPGDKVRWAYYVGADVELRPISEMLDNPPTDALLSIHPHEHGWGYDESVIMRSLQDDPGTVISRVVNHDPSVLFIDGQPLDTVVKYILSRTSGMSLLDVANSLWILSQRKVTCA